MKKFTLSLLFSCLFLSGFAQNETDKQSKNEVKLNGAYMLAGIFEVGYTRLINEESSFGVDVLYSNANNYIQFALTPNYRFYFGNDYANGFFVEAFGMLNTIETEYYEGFFSTYNYADETDFALGFAVGGKFITNSEFVFEIYGGVGRNFFNKNSEDFVPRVGLTIGKRF